MSSPGESSTDGYLLLGAVAVDSPGGSSSCWSITSFDCVESTMEVAKRWSTNPTEPRWFFPQLPSPVSLSRRPVVFVAREQTRGRGRQGHPWISAPDQGLYFTALWLAPGDATRYVGFSLAVGTVVAEALARLGFSVRCKWPNDLVVETADGVAKLGGLLIETWRAGDAGLWVSCGVGVNLRKHAQLSEVGGIALEDLGKAPTRGTLLVEILRSLTGAIELFQHQGLRPFIAKFENYSILSGRTVVILRDGQERSYTVQGVSPDGGLQVCSSEDGAQVEVLYAGEVTLRHAYRR